MEDECRVQLDASVDTQDNKQTTQGVKLSSKLTTTLLIFTLCLAAAAAAAVLVFNRHAKGPEQDEDNFGENFLNSLKSSVLKLILMIVTVSFYIFLKSM